MDTSRLRAPFTRIRPHVRRWHVVVAAAVVLVAAAAAVGTNGSSGTRAATHSAVNLIAPAPPGAPSVRGPAPNLPALGAPTGTDTSAGGTAASAGGGASAAGGGYAASAGGSSAQAPSLATDALGPGDSAKVVQTAAMSVQVPADRVAASLRGIALIAAAYPGGFVADQHSDGTTDHPSGTVTIRVPNANFNDALTAAGRLGKVVSTQVSGKDVTAEYVDLQARLQALQSTRQQFETLLLKAQSIPDILNVQDRISGLQVQIEQLQGQQKVLDDQTTFATLTVSVSDLAVPPPTPVKARSGFAKAWHDAGHGFTSAVQRVISGLGILAFWLIVVALGATAAVVARRLARRGQTSGSVAGASPTAADSSAPV